MIALTDTMREFGLPSPGTQNPERKHGVHCKDLRSTDGKINKRQIRRLRLGTEHKFEEAPCKAAYPSHAN